MCHPADHFLHENYDVTQHYSRLHRQPFTARHRAYPQSPYPHRGKPPRAVKEPACLATASDPPPASPPAKALPQASSARAPTAAVLPLSCGPGTAAAAAFRTCRVRDAGSSLAALPHRHLRPSPYDLNESSFVWMLVVIHLIPITITDSAFTTKDNPYSIRRCPPPGRFRFHLMTYPKRVYKAVCAWHGPRLGGKGPAQGQCSQRPPSFAQHRAESSRQVQRGMDTQG